MVFFAASPLLSPCESLQRATIVDGEISHSAATITWGSPGIRALLRPRAKARPVTTGSGCRRIAFNPRPRRGTPRCRGASTIRCGCRVLLFSTGYMANLGIVTRSSGARTRSIRRQAQSRIAQRWRCCCIAPSSSDYAHGDLTMLKGSAASTRRDASWSSAMRCSAWTISRRADCCGCANADVARVAAARLTRMASACWAPAKRAGVLQHCGIASNVSFIYGDGSGGRRGRRVRCRAKPI